MLLLIARVTYIPAPAGIYYYADIVIIATKIKPNSPTILIVVALVPLFPTPSVTLQVCTPASVEIRQFLEMDCEEEL